MNIKDVFESVANTVNPSGTFRHGSEPEQNVVSDDDAMPVIYMDDPVKQNDRVTQSGVYRRWKPFLMFAKLGEISSIADDSDKETIVADMRTLCDLFVKTLMNETDEFGRKLFREIVSVEKMESYDWGDENLVGVTASFEIEELVPYARC